MIVVALSSTSSRTPASTGPPAARRTVSMVDVLDAAAQEGRSSPLRGSARQGRKQFQRGALNHDERNEALVEI